MFTGLVESVGELIERKTTGGGLRLCIASALAPELSNGESIAVNGVCLTVIHSSPDQFHADVGPETIRVTTLGRLERGSAVNLERPLRADQRFGGHFVQGHVDGMGHIEELRADAEFHWLTISLTVAGLGADRFDVQLVPYTIDHTNLRRAQKRDRVNLEVDMVGKYVVRAAELAGLTLTGARAGDVTH
jgi:riboflavin synthase